MKIQNYELNIKNSKKGFTLVEILISLAISAMLLTAIATAFNGSLVNYSNNEDMYKTINSARQALVRITTQLRTAIPLYDPLVTNECTMFTANGENITYRYNSDDDKLYLITNDDTTDSDYVLCDNVTSMSFTKNPTEDLECKSVQISMTVNIGDTQKTISAATVIRRNLN